MTIRKQDEGKENQSGPSTFAAGTKTSPKDGRDSAWRKRKLFEWDGVRSELLLQLGDNKLIQRLGLGAGSYGTGRRWASRAISRRDGLGHVAVLLHHDEHDTDPSNYVE